MPLADQRAGRRGLLLLREPAGRGPVLLRGPRPHGLQIGRPAPQQRSAGLVKFGDAAQMPTGLILRSALLRASRRMAATPCRASILRDASLPDSPQDEVDA